MFKTLKEFDRSDLKLPLEHFASNLSACDIVFSALWSSIFNGLLTHKISQQHKRQKEPRQNASVRTWSRGTFLSLLGEPASRGAEKQRLTDIHVWVSPASLFLSRHGGRCFIRVVAIGVCEIKKRRLDLLTVKWMASARMLSPEIIRMPPLDRRACRTHSPHRSCLCLRHYRKPQYSQRGKKSTENLLRL